MSRQSGDDISDKYCVLPSDIFRLSLLNETETANIFINYYHKITFTLILKFNKIIMVFLLLVTITLPKSGACI